MSFVQRQLEGRLPAKAQDLFRRLGKWRSGSWPQPHMQRVMLSACQSAPPMLTGVQVSPVTEFTAQPLSGVDGKIDRAAETDLLCCGSDATETAEDVSSNIEKTGCGVASCHEAPGVQFALIRICFVKYGQLPGSIDRQTIECTQRLFRHKPVLSNAGTSSCRHRVWTEPSVP